MRALVIVILSPAFQDHFRLRETDEDLHIQAFIAQFVVKTFPESVLPGAAGVNVMGLDPLFGEPGLDRFGHELRTVVATKIGGETLLRKDTLQYTDHGLSRHSPLDFDAQTFTSELIDQCQNSQFPSVQSDILHKIVRPHMIRVVGLDRNRSFVLSSPLSFSAAQRKPFAFPNPVHALAVDSFSAAHQ